MDKYIGLTKEKLIDLLKEKDAIIKGLLHEKTKEESLDYAWTGNLGKWYWDIQSNKVTFNKLKVLALGYDEEEIPQEVPYTYFTEKLHPEDFEHVMENMKDHMMNKTPAYEVEYRIKAKDGSYKWFYDRGAVVSRDEAGKPLSVTGIVFNITEQKSNEMAILEMNEQLKRQVKRDSLTGLLNHGAIYEELSKIVKVEAESYILMFDIDYFKEINDHYGHLKGDEALKSIANIINKHLNDDEAVASRYGGDEFIIVFKNKTYEQALEISKSIHRAINDIFVDEQEHLTISGGFTKTVFNRVNKTINQVDELLYQSKEQGRNKITVKK